MIDQFYSLRDDDATDKSPPSCCPGLRRSRRRVGPQPLDELQLGLLPKLHSGAPFS